MEFVALVAERRAEGLPLPLDRACLAMSAVFDSKVSVDPYLARLDEMAARARERAGDGANAYALAGALIKTLFIDEHFTGNESSYYDPRNSLLSAVMDRRLGIPITLSILFIEVGRRLGLELPGIGLPGHFVVRFPDPTSQLYVDPYRAGRIIDDNECVAIVDRLYRGRITWHDKYLEPVDAALIIKRLLLNLRNSLTQEKNYPAALAAVELQIAVDPDDPTELRDRGILFARLHRYDRAIDDLESYLRRLPDAGDGEHIRNTVQYLRQVKSL